MEFEHNVLSYELGVGYRFSPVWSGAIWLGYVKQDAGLQPNLSPKDGRKVVGLGATYGINNLRLSAGISYIAIGDATSSGAGGVTGQFKGRSALSAGTKIGCFFDSTAHCSRSVLTVTGATAAILPEPPGA